MTKIITVIFLLTPLLITTGCNTTQGLGRDIQHAGTAIENASGEPEPTNKSLPNK